MTFSKEWNIAYKKNTHMSIWPWPDLISYVKRYTKLDKQSKILEIGCGAGANIPFFLSLGVQYYGMDGNNVTIKKLKKKFPELKDRLIIGDFTKELPFLELFDLIVDRSSLTHNHTNAISNCISLIEKKLTDHGLFIGIDWFSTIHTDYSNGISIDKYTKTGYTKGQFANVGLIHFSNKRHLLELFSNFNISHLEHKIVKLEIPNNNYQAAYWNLIAKKSNKSNHNKIN